MNVNQRIGIERRIISRAVADILAQNRYSITVYDGLLFTLKNSVDHAAIMDSIMTTDEDLLIVSENGVNIGNVYFVYGNDGWDVIADYHTNLAGLLEGAQELAEDIAEGYWESKCDTEEECRLS